MDDNLAVKDILIYFKVTKFKLIKHFPKGLFLVTHLDIRGHINRLQYSECKHEL